MRIPVTHTEKVARLLPSLKILFSSFMPSVATNVVLQEEIKYKEVFGGARNASSILKTKINMKKISKTEKLSLMFLTIRPINK